MKSNREIRREALSTLRGKWLWRILCVFFFLQFCFRAVTFLLSKLNRRCGIVELNDFLSKKVAALQQGLDYSLPTQADYSQMFVATGFEYFIGAVFSAIALFGLTAILLKALHNDERSWFAEGMGGFRRPLGITGLLVVQNLVVSFWSLFFVVPGIVAAYRYRLVWYLKCENPDWGIGRCLGESARMMKGYKGRAFLFDLSYVGWLFLVSLFAAAGYLLGGRGADGVNMVGSLLASIAILGFVYLMVWFVAGRAAFYREVCRSVGAEGSAETSDSVTPSACQKK